MKPQDLINDLKKMKLIEVAKKHQRSTDTIHRWIKQLRDKGHIISLKRGRPPVFDD